MSSKKPPQQRHEDERSPPRILTHYELEAMVRDGSYRREHFLIQLLAEQIREEQS